jgi:glycosyltransferase involved in cell wall biosynthesis
MKCPRLIDLPAPPSGRIGWPWTEASNNSEWLEKRLEWPRVSLVIPSFNQGDFIEESIRSILLQGYPDLEFFIYDANSSDGSSEIIRKYEPWLTSWASEEDKGQSNAINKGLKKSTGKYFNWQNSDDGYYLVIYATGEMHSCAEKAYGPPTRFAPSVSDSISILKTGVQPGGLMDRDLVVRVGGIDESMHFAMDMDILLKLSVIKPPLYLHEELFHYRFHPNIKSFSEWPKERRFEKLRIVENLFKMPEARKYASTRRQALSTGHRYAAHCSWMSNDIYGFLYHLLMDIVWLPFRDWDRRRALFYYINERKKGLQMGAQ